MVLVILFNFSLMYALMCILTVDQTSIGMGDLPTWVSAFAAIILAIITYWYVRLVKAQSDTMTDQGKIMQESIKRDRIIRKYERLAKEMDDLVGPLFSKMDDNTVQYFYMVDHSSEGSLAQEVYAFWRDIKKDIYLAPRDLRISLSNYLDARQKFRRVMEDHSTPPGEERTIIRTTFDQSVEDLKPKIRSRYDELSRQLEECRMELES